MSEWREGGCHCGAVRFRVRGDFSKAILCNCSICTKKGFLHLIVPGDCFQLLAGQDALSLYEFNTKTAKHYFCKTCGIYVYHQRRSDPDECGVNLGCVEGGNPRTHGTIPWNDGVNHPSDRSD